MQQKINSISDLEFLTQFEDHTLDPSYFNHLGHLRLAWLYLNSHDLDTSISLASSGIQSYATSLGASTKFHLTITDSIVRIMAIRIAKLEQNDWPSFVAENTDLVEDALSVLDQYFTRDKLLSEKARVSLLSPDIQPIQ